MRVSVPDRSASHDFLALLDTGAQGTMVTQKVVDALNASSIGVDSFMPASGKPQETDQYRLRIDIPIDYPITGGSPSFSTHATGLLLDVLVMPFQPRQFDVLLGMDLITAGYHITVYRNTVTFSN